MRECDRVKNSKPPKNICRISTYLNLEGDMNGTAFFQFQKGNLTPNFLFYLIMLTDF